MEWLATEENELKIAMTPAAEMTIKVVQPQPATVASNVKQARVTIRVGNKIHGNY